MRPYTWHLCLQTTKMLADGKQNFLEVEIRNFEIVKLVLDMPQSLRSPICLTKKNHTANIEA